MTDPALERKNYYWFTPITTRWMDNDVYGHVNNVIYYSYFDTVANNYLIEQGVLDISQSPTIGYCVHSQCHYKSAIAYPDKIEGGFRVNKLGNSSVEYGIAIFKQGVDKACAYGSFTHVFVNRADEKPTPISGELRNALEQALSAGATS